MTKAQKKKLESILRLIPGYDPFATAGDAWLDHERAQQAIDFFAACLKHVEGAIAGQPFVLEPWQQAIIGNLFGWVRKDRKGRIVRRYRELLLYVPRKNGKTPLAAGICLLVLFCDPERGKQIFGAAGDSDQAAMLYRHARGMVQQEPELNNRATIYGGDNHRSIVLRDDQASTYRVISAEADTKHGGNSSLILIDELHVQQSRDLVDTMRTSMASENRAQPLLVYITTADYERPSICNEVYEHAAKVRDRVLDDPAFLPAIYEAAEGDDWRDPDVWAKANPNLGVSVSLDYLARECKKAEENPAYENTFRRLHLNQRTKQDIKAISLEVWDKCPGEKIDPEELRGLPCYLGLDMASTEDLASASLVFPFPDDELRIITKSWCPEEKIVRRKRQRVDYDVWAAQGWIEATGGSQIDYDVIFEQITAWMGMYNIRECGFDGWGAAQITNDLSAVGLKMVKIPPSFVHLSGPTKEFLRRLRLGKLWHGGNPVSRWAAGNVSLAFDGKVPAGAELNDHLDRIPIMFSKKKSADKIDPITSIVLAICRLIANPTDGGTSRYETEKPMVIGS